MLRLPRITKLFSKVNNKQYIRKTQCLVLHPVSFPNKGPIVEQYLAEEAIGLVRSLNWNVVQGPYWNAVKMNNTPEIQDQQQKPPREGEYYQDPYIKGSNQGGGVIVDVDSSESDGDLFDQWKNKLLRESLANKSLIRTKQITSKLFFTRGKAESIANFVRNNDIDCVFINNQLTPVQIKNLKKLFEAKANNKSPPRSATSDKFDTETEFESEPEIKESDKKIKIFDRFSIILQIFARRAKTNIAKLQIQLNFLNYLKTRLVRSEGSTYNSSYNIFYGDLMRAQQVNLQIVSARQRRAHAAMSGAGESQLEIERRQIRDRQSKIKKQLDEQKRIRGLEMEKKKVRRQFMSQIGLIGYTNAGKSKLMNRILKKTEVSSENMLFQTLNTTARQFQMPSGRKALLLDTIGFITNLPHELVQSFKVTLQEVEDCNIVLHIRDISNPNHELQKQTVLKVLRELKFPQSFYEDRMIEVWNKIDLVGEQLDAPPGVIQISALKGTGIQKLLTEIEKKASKTLNLGLYKFKYGIEHHFKRMQWLKDETNSARYINEVYDYVPSKQFPSGTVEFEIELDPKAYGRFMKYIDEPIAIRKEKKGMPPADWHKK